MTDLLSRLSSATGPSRELDAEIALANGWEKRTRADCEPYWRSPAGQICPQPPRYTESIDAALTLVPNGWHAVIDHRDNLDGSSSVVLHEFPLPCRRIPDAPFAILSKSAAIALLIAIEKAKRTASHDRVRLSSLMA